jgi:hypothetical protein
MLGRSALLARQRPLPHEHQNARAEGRHRKPSPGRERSRCRSRCPACSAWSAPAASSRVRPQIPPDSHRVIWGLTSRPPGPPAGLPSASRLPAGLVPLRPPSRGLPSSGVSGSGPSAGSWSRAARAKVTSPAATSLAWIARDRPEPYGQRLGHHGMPRRNRLPRGRRAQGIAAPEPPAGVGHALCAATDQATARARLEQQA